jgi:DNA-binding NarL/FixJ family response regulator
VKYQTLTRQEHRTQLIPSKEVVQPANACTVCIIESNPLAAEYLAGILEQDAVIDVRLFDQFVSSGSQTSPLIFCLDQTDVVLPLRECLKLLKLSYPYARYILLDTEMESGHLSILLNLGIQGILKYENVKECLLEAVRAVSKGLLWVHPEFVHNVSPPSRFISEFVRSEPLTEREGEILHLVQNHFSNKEISMLLGIEESTVKFHLSNIFAKRHVSRREDLGTKWRIASGWKTLLLAEIGTTNPVLRSLLK